MNTNTAFRMKLLEYIQERNDSLKLDNDNARGDSLKIFEVGGACDELGRLLDFVSSTMEGV